VKRVLSVTALKVNITSTRKLRNFETTTSVFNAVLPDTLENCSIVSESPPNGSLDQYRNDTMTQSPKFECFGKLPEHLRAKIYEQICSLPRVVDVRELYRSFTSLARKCDIWSKTRVPAILHVSQEARKYALTKYTPIDQNLQSENEDEHVDECPVYVNQEVDVVYRGKSCCNMHAQFTIRYPYEWSRPLPTAFSKTLAVNLHAVIGDGTLTYGMSAVEVGLDPTSNAGREYVRTTDFFRRAAFFDQRAAEIVKLGIEGVSEVIVVLDNDDEMTEFDLCELESTSESWTPREKGVFHAVRWLENSVGCAWSILEAEEDPSIIDSEVPKITVRFRELLPIPETNSFRSKSSNVLHCSVFISSPNFLWNYKN
jgi:hypothetical protein